MDPKFRKDLKPGLRVAIVLKRDQGSGKRTLGEIDTLLTSAPWHPRGIKVKLKDGQVGRVQEILPNESRSLEERHLGILLLRNATKHWYFREADSEDGTPKLSLGVDCDLENPPADDSTPREFLQFLPAEQSFVGLQRALDLTFESSERLLKIWVYLAELPEVVDQEASQWRCYGWISQDDLLGRMNQRTVSQETEIILQELLTAGVIA